MSDVAESSKDVLTALSHYLRHRSVRGEELESESERDFLLSLDDPGHREVDLLIFRAMQLAHDRGFVGLTDYELDVVGPHLQVRRAIAQLLVQGLVVEHQRPDGALVYVAANGLSNRSELVGQPSHSGS